MKESSYYEKAKALVDAAKMTLKKPSVSYFENLKAVSPEGRNITDLLIAKGVDVSGAVITQNLLATSTISFFGLGVGLMAPPILMGPIALYKAYSNYKRRSDEKYRCLQEIIIQQQAIIDNLREQNYKGEQELQNLKVSLAVLERFVKESL